MARCKCCCQLKARSLPPSALRQPPPSSEGGFGTILFSKAPRRAARRLALPMGELSPQVTERAFRAASPLRPRFARPPAQVASTACSPLWLQTAHRAVCLTRRAQKERQGNSPASRGALLKAPSDEGAARKAKTTPAFLQTEVVLSQAICRKCPVGSQGFARSCADAFSAISALKAAGLRRPPLSQSPMPRL